MNDPIQNAIIENYAHLVSCGWGYAESILAVAANFNRSENEIAEIVKHRG